MRAFVALAAAVVASSPATGTSSSGLRGLVTRGPITPVCVAGQPCSEPAKNVTLVFSRNGRVVRRARTNDQGRYRVALAPGRYRVVAPARTAGVGRGLDPTSVTVPRSRYKRVNFTLDVGIR